MAFASMLKSKVTVEYCFCISFRHVSMNVIHKVRLRFTGPMASRRRKLGQKAKGILLEYADELPVQLQKMLVAVKGMMVQKEIIENDAIDLGVVGVSAEQNAANLYDAVVTSLEFNPVKFPKVVSIFKSFTTLTTIADELEQAGRVDTIYIAIQKQCNAAKHLNFEGLQLCGMVSLSILFTKSSDTTEYMYMYNCMCMCTHMYMYI